jgi:signal peptidase I
VSNKDVSPSDVASNADAGDLILVPKKGSWLTFGSLIGLLVGMSAVYFLWGRFFQPGGTGSNVVLGILVAGVGIYFVTSNLGPTLNDRFFSKEPHPLARARRQTYLTWNEFHRLYIRICNGKEKDLKKDAKETVLETLNNIAIALRDTEDQKTSTKETATRLQEALAKAEQCAETIFNEKGGKSVWVQMRSLVIALSIALALRAFVVEPFQIPSGSMIPTLLIGDHLFVARSMYGLTSPFSEKPSYLVRWGTPEPGDVVVFVAPSHVGLNAGEDWIKRVIAGPGQKVRVAENVIFVDDKPYAHIEGPTKEEYDDHDEFNRRWYKTAAHHIRERVERPDGTSHAHSMYLSYLTPRKWPPDFPDINRSLKGLTCNRQECRVNEGHVFVMGDNRDHSKDGRSWGAVPIEHVKGKALFVWMSVDGSQRSIELGRFTLPQFRWERMFQGIQ